jgi:Uncharacterised protein family
MLYLFRLLFLLINIDQETVLNWFGINNPNNENFLNDNVNLSTLDTPLKPAVSIETLNLIIKGLWQHVQEGLNLADIENILFFILFIRFIILAIRYNLKTSLYITCIGLVAGYLWYRHLIDLISLYRSTLIQLPYLHKLGMDSLQLKEMSRQIALTDLKLGDNVHWYNPGQVIYYAFVKGIVNTDSETGMRYYIDPISMIISNLNESQQSTVLPIYYKIYNKIIPQVFEGISKFWSQLSGIAAYAVITRIGKKYCPYLVRWHWTFLLIVGFLEQILVYLWFRVTAFQYNIIIPQIEDSIESGSNYISQSLISQANALNGLTVFILCLHFGLIFFGLFHAIWGQYFYIPFLVENTELHIGVRPKNSIYSGGNTAWQDEKDQNIDRVFPKLWYGWFGSGTKSTKSPLSFLQNLIAKIIKQVRKKFQR